MNSVNLIGRLTRDPSLTEYGKGKNAGLLARFTLAVRRDAENADFISCVAFGKTAELIDQYIGKGSQLGVTGSIQTGKYEDKEGDTHYTTDVIVRQIDFIGSSKDEDEEKPRKKSGKTSAKTSEKKSSRRRKDEDEEEDEDDEEDPEFIDPNDLDDELPFV